MRSRKGVASLLCQHRSRVWKTDARTHSLEVIPAWEWRGAQFLADSWELSAAKAEHLFAYRSLFSPSTAWQRLEKAIALYREDLKGKL
jgi:hypothetical protein